MPGHLIIPPDHPLAAPISSVPERSGAPQFPYPQVVKDNPKALDRDGAAKLLAHCVAEDGGQRQVARDLCISQSTLSEVINGKRRIPDDLADIIGLKRIELWVVEPGSPADKWEGC